MRQAEIRNMLFTIIANLRKANPDFKRIIDMVSDLDVEVGRGTPFMQLAPGDAPPMMNEKPSEIRAELENLTDALSAKDIANSLAYAGAALGYCVE
jgi:hypothetical protein